MHLILHKDGIYNLYSSIVDAPLYERGLTYDELVEVITEEEGRLGLQDLPQRLERAHEKGSSHRSKSHTLESCIEFNRAGPNESCLTYDEIINEFFSPTQKLCLR